jgi:hypothetical protein
MQLTLRLRWRLLQGFESVVCEYGSNSLSFDRLLPRDVSHLSWMATRIVFAFIGMPSCRRGVRLCVSKGASECGRFVLF